MIFTASAQGLTYQGLQFISTSGQVSAPRRTKSVSQIFNEVSMEISQLFLESAENVTESMVHI